MLNLAYYVDTVWELIQARDVDRATASALHEVARTLNMECLGTHHDLPAIKDLIVEGDDEGLKGSKDMFITLERIGYGLKTAVAFDDIRDDRWDQVCSHIADGTSFGHDPLVTYDPEFFEQYHRNSKESDQFSDVLQHNPWLVALWLLQWVRAESIRELPNPPVVQDS